MEKHDHRPKKNKTKIVKAQTNKNQIKWTEDRYQKTPYTINKKGQNESKIYTPEQEQSLYESRFDNRNDRIFDKLKKLWAK